MPSLAVMQTFRESASTNPYLRQLLRSLPPDINTIQFSWRRALLGRYSVVHVHWPENLLRGPRGWLTPFRYLLVLLLLLRIQVSRIAVVRTLHNVRAHERGGVLERAVLGLWDRATSLYITLNTLTPVPPGVPSMMIPHGHYRDWFAEFEHPPAIQGRLLTFGLIRRYKGVGALAVAFSEVKDDHVSLWIVGQPKTSALAEDIQRVAMNDPRISLQLDFVSDGELSRQIGRCELVVLAYSELHNSGALLLALSLNRPVLVPMSAATLALRDEVGADWIIPFEGEICSSVIQDACDWLSVRCVASAPDLSNRDWDVIGTSHQEAYRTATARKRHRGAARHE